MEIPEEPSRRGCLHLTGRQTRITGHMAPLRSNSDSGPKGLRRAGDDAFKLTVDYLKQEALEPLKGLGRFVAWGLAGSFAIAVGILLLLVGILRLLQDETGTALTGDWSWVPYFAVSLLGLGVAGIAVWRITAGPARRKLPRHSKKALETQATEIQATEIQATEIQATEIQATEIQATEIQVNGTQEGKS
jgi:hypothetical protein